MSSAVRRSKRKTSIRRKKSRARALRLRSSRLPVLQIEAFMIYIIAIFCVLVLAWALYENFFSRKITRLKIQTESVAAFRIPHKTLSDLKQLGEKYALPFHQLVALYAVQNEFFPYKTSAPAQTELEQTFIMGFEKLEDTYRKSLLVPYYELFQNLFEDIRHFPIASGYHSDGSLPYMYGDSWGETGNDREYPGTDILDRENVKGRIPIVSMTSGTVETIGWDETVGYRIGIRSKSGNYYYYAHFESLSTGLAKDVNVTAGQFLGYMGDTGSHTVRLHLAVSPKTKLARGRFWINPYPFLRYIEDSKVYYEWREP